MTIEWKKDDNHEFPTGNIQFSQGYDFSGFSDYAMIGFGANDTYKAFPRDYKKTHWSLISKKDGGLCFEQFNSFEEAKAVAERWDLN